VVPRGSSERTSSPSLPGRPFIIPSGRTLHRGAYGWSLKISPCKCRRPFRGDPSSRPEVPRDGVLIDPQVAVPSGTALHRGGCTSKSTILPVTWLPSLPGRPFSEAQMPARQKCTAACAICSPSPRPGSPRRRGCYAAPASRRPLRGAQRASEGLIMPNTCPERPSVLSFSSSQHDRVVA
jgi:hypothetical protein